MALGDVSERLARVDAFLHLPAQLDEIAFLLFEQVLAGERTVAGQDAFDVELLHRVRGRESTTRSRNGP